MKAVEAKLLDFLEGKKQFIIPIYQRTYSWTLEQCEQLWNDVKNAAINSHVRGHFIGSIVYVEPSLYETTITSIPKYLVIDGQQRLTTITLLLQAMRKALSTPGVSATVTAEEISDYYLFNKHGQGDLHYKLMLTQSDRQTLINLLEGRDPPVPSSSHVITNYKFFEEQIETSKVDLSAIYAGIGKLLVVDIHLNRDHDNPQHIFESLNSTGLALSQADLIRNYVLMGLEPDHQAQLYHDHWYPMEESFGHAEYTAQFNRFMRDYLTVKSPSGAIPKTGEVYAAFKTYVSSSDGEAAIDSIVADIHQYSRYFVRLAFAREQDKEINEIIRDINALRVEVTYPFLLELYDDYSSQILSRADFVSILKLVESYVLRRAVCGLPPNSLNKTFAAVTRQIDKSKYLESVQAYFLLQDSYGRFPKDEEFYFDFQLKDVYNSRIRTYLLDKLENYNHKERLPIDGFTIEHIMPQNDNLSAEWQRDLGPDWQTVQAQYLHTIGNLTLTGYNSELSDRPFREKRDMTGGFRDSHLRLNHRLSELEVWNKAEIEKRAEELADKALKIWPYPTLSVREIDRYKQRKITKGVPTVPIDEYLAHFDPKRQEQFQLLRKRILNLDPSIEEVVYKERPDREWPDYHISYSSAAPFVDIVLQKVWIRLCINANPDQLDDPKHRVTDVTGKGYWGGGNSVIYITYGKDHDYALHLVRQALELQLGSLSDDSDDAIGDTL
jgi:uncharacterized protein with ParB-like and HNH nuclease domain/predicted transport protein